MKITKEEKSLWNFLNIFKNIFSKTNNRTIVFGMNNSLYLYTLNYAGKFISKQSQDKLMTDYQFDNSFYELKQLPDNRFVLDIIDDPISQSELTKIITMIDDLIQQKTFCCEVDKHDDFKIAKITETSRLWMADNDVKYINTFPEAEISASLDSLIIRAVGINNDEVFTVETFLIFNQLEVVHTVQQKMDIENLNKKSALLDQEKTIIQNKLNELNNIAKFNFNIEEIIIFLNDMKNKLNESDKKIKRTLIEAFVYKISINEDDVDIMLYLDNLINKNCDNIGGGEGNRTPVQA